VEDPDPPIPYDPEKLKKGMREYFRQERERKEREAQAKAHEESRSSVASGSRGTEHAIRLRADPTRGTSMKNPLWERLPTELQSCVDELIRAASHRVAGA